MMLGASPVRTTPTPARCDGHAAVITGAELASHSGSILGEKDVKGASDHQRKRN